MSGVHRLGDFGGLTYLTARPGLPATDPATVSHSFAIASIWAAAVLALAALLSASLITNRPYRHGSMRRGQSIVESDRVEAQPRVLSTDAGDSVPD